MRRGTNLGGAARSIPAPPGQARYHVVRPDLDGFDAAVPTAAFAVFPHDPHVGAKFISSALQRDRPMRIIIAVIIAAGYGIIALSAPPTASADECPPGYHWSKSHATCVERPDNNPVGAAAQCADGKYSHSESRSDTCSENGGVARPCPCADAAAATPTAVYSNDYLYAQYNNFLATHGIDTSEDATRANAERMADQICSSLDAGMPFDQLARTLNSQIGNPHQESLFLVGAVDFQCPQHEAAMNAWLDSSSVASPVS